MYFNPRLGHAFRGLKIVAAILWGLAIGAPVLAGQYQLLSGETNTVVVGARVQNGEQNCHLEIAVQGQTLFEREVKAPHFETQIDITPQDTETVMVSWRGKFKRLNGELINACPTQGQASYKVVPGNAALQSVWGGLLSQMSPDKADCVRTALQIDRVRYEWFDLSDSQMSPEDWKIQRAMTQCDSFVAQKKAWGVNNPKSFACTLPNGLKTQCEGYFTVTVNGKTQPISREAAIRRQLENQTWGTGVRETTAAQAGRQRKEQALKAKVIADEAAKIKAAEDTRILAEQQAVEAQATQERERKEKAEADRLRRLAEIERLENERLEKRSWLLKQLEKLKRDPKEEGKTAGKSDAKEEGKTVSKEDDKAGSAKPQEPKPK